MDWPLTLRTRPHVAHLGVGIHGVGRLTETFRLPTLWCVHLYTYHGEVVCNGHSLEIRPGCASVFPPGSVLEYRYRGKSVHLYAHFTLPPAPRPLRIPAMQNLAGEFPRLYASFEEAIAWRPAQPLRTDIRLWDILWQLASFTQPSAAHATHPAVEQTRRTIELSLADALYVTELASQVHLSQNHLTRLFRAATGMTPTAYIRHRRIQRARHLLAYSTLPIKSIAAQVGIPDLHLFNKVIRQSLGASPRRVRLERTHHP